MNSSLNGIKHFVSIIITSYNYEKFLKDAIESALNQTYPGSEVIIVDDGSTDRSREIIASYGKKVIPVLKENGGQGSAFNAGFRASRGDIIIFLDSDDMLFPDSVEQIVNVWQNGISKLHFSLQGLDANGIPMNSFIPHQGQSLLSGDLSALLLRQGVYRTTPTTGNAFARGFLESVFPIPEGEWRLCPDAYLHAQAPFYGTVAAINRPLGYYRMHGGNASAAIRKKPTEERLVEEIYFRNKCEALIRKTAEKMRLTADFDNTVIIVRKLALLRLNPSHDLVTEERVAELALRGLRAIRKEKEIPLVKKAVVGTFLGVFPFLPRRLAVRMAFWYLYPETRTAFISRVARA
jgi:glycosyltransferase involved in cell wall biosynthesis